MRGAGNATSNTSTAGSNASPAAASARTDNWSTAPAATPPNNAAANRPWSARTNPMRNPTRRPVANTGREKWRARNDEPPAPSSGRHAEARCRGSTGGSGTDAPASCESHRVSAANAGELRPTAERGQPDRARRRQGFGFRISGSACRDKTYRSVHAVYPDKRHRIMSLILVGFSRLTVSGGLWQPLRCTPLWGLLVVRPQGKFHECSESPSLRIAAAHRRRDSSGHVYAVALVQKTV